MKSWLIVLHEIHGGTLNKVTLWELRDLAKANWKEVRIKCARKEMYASSVLIHYYSSKDIGSTGLGRVRQDKSLLHRHKIDIS